MFLLSSCSVAGCRRHAVQNSEVCFAHLPKPEAWLSDTEDFLRNGTHFSSLVLNRATLRNLDLKGKRFDGCAFLGIVWENILLDKSEFRNCFLDFSSFTGCLGEKITMVFCSVSGSSMRHCRWTGSDILHVNFNGIEAEDTEFSDSDLYFSRFNAGSLKRVAFRDCNLKKTQFLGTVREDVSFKYSNDDEAEMEEDGGFM